LKLISQKAKEKGKRIRCFCNICQSTWADTPSLKTFFIRPEDIPFYSNYVDTFLFAVDERDHVRINTLYKIYAKQQKWFGQLKELILRYTGEEDSRFILPIFAEKRSKCGKKCILDNPCQICDRIVTLGDSIRAKNLIIKTSKEYLEYDNGNEESSN
jgi:ribosomal protein L44E